MDLTRGIMDLTPGRLTEPQGGAWGAPSADLETRASRWPLPGQGNRICLWESDRPRFKFIYKLCDPGQATYPLKLRHLLWEGLG